MEKEQTFKICTCCSKVWQTRVDFLQDSNVEIKGYQPNFDNLELGHFLFQHSCGSTISIHPQKFIDLYKGPIYKTKLLGTESCPGYCLHSSELKPCPLQCECAYVREIMWIIKTWKKSEVIVTDQSPLFRKKS